MSFTNDHISVSRLRLFEACPYAFFCRYVDPEPRDPNYVPPEAPAFGIVLHETLERLYQWVVDEEFAGHVPLDRAVEFFRDAWQASHLTNVALYQEGLGILRAYLRDNPEADHWKILDVEHEFDIDLGPFTLNGAIDRVDKVDDTTVEIIDYKSNRLLFSKDDLEADLQMSAYGLVARERFPWAKELRFTFHMLRFSLPQSARRTPEQLDDARDYLIAIGRRTEQGSYPARLNPNCVYCDYRHRCAPYQAELKRTTITKFATSDDLVSVLAEREQVAQLAKLAYGRRDELDKIIKAHLAEKGDFVANDTSVRMLQIYANTYPRDAVVAAFVDAGLDRVTVENQILELSPKSVDDLLKASLERTDIPRPKLLMLKARVESLATKIPSFARLDVKKKGGKDKRTEDSFASALGAMPPLKS